MDSRDVKNVKRGNVKQSAKTLGTPIGSFA